MNKIRATIAILMAISSVSIFFTSCKGKISDRMIIVTRSTASTDISNTNTSSWRYIPQSQIVLIDPDRSESSEKILTTAFYSARAPQVSYDGTHMIFAGQLKQTDPWSIWEMDLNDMKYKGIIALKENCIDPQYLPGERIVCSKFTQNDSLKSEHSLFTCNIDGSNFKRITFNPYTYVASQVLKDGRILTLGSQVYPKKGKRMLMVLRPDGTKTDIFYCSDQSNVLTSPATETTDGRIVFIEAGNNPGEKGNVISITYNRPLHSRVNLTAGIGGDFYSVVAGRSGKLLVTYRKSKTDRIALYEFDPETKSLGKALYDDHGYDILEAVEAGPHEKPKKLPSEVDMGVKTGLIMCQDINVTENHYSGKESSRIEIAGIDSTLGIVDAAADGSFYLKVIADKPFQIKTIDKNGKIISTPCGWIWLRPNERRGCVGCHQNPEMVPGNKVPLAVKKSPVNIPMHINKVVEKKVSLE